MNNKPVAYIHKTISGWTSTFIHPETEPDEWLPLYTHPVKELTDEEILQQAEWIFGTYFFECIDDPYWIEFAKAILRKAQEK